MADADQLEYLLSHLKIRKRRGDTAECLCPAHDDHQASLSVSRGTDVPVVLHCHAGCAPEAVMAAVGLTMADLGSLTPRRVAVYYYTDAQGNALYSVERWVPKTFRPRLPSGAYARPHPADEVLYNLPAVQAAISAGTTVYLVEGERDVETAREFGLVATTSMSGADQRWLPQFSEQLDGARLVIVADNDVKGRHRARMLLDELHDHCKDMRAVVARYGKDLTDHLLAGYSLQTLDPLPAEGALVRFSLAHVLSTPITWAWNDWIPAGMLSLIEGDPGEGKSVLTCELAARWTTGTDMPDSSPNPFGVPVRVGIVSAEDDAARVIKPRIQVAGGAPDRVVCFSGMPIVGTRYQRSLDLEIDVEPLRDAIEDEHLRVLILDPLMAFLGTTKTAIDNEVRKVLTPLRYLAEETGCAIVAIRHLRKSGGKAVYAGGGSIAFTGAARAVMIINRHPVDHEKRVLAMTKTNLGPMPTSLMYHVTPDVVGFMSAPHVLWDGETSLTAADLMRLTEDGSVGAEVRNAVVELLGIQPLTFADVRKQLLLRGVEHGESTLRQVLRTVADQEVENRGLPGAIYRWRLKPDMQPDVEPTADAETTDREVDGALPTVGVSDAPPDDVVVTDQQSPAEDQPPTTTTDAVTTSTNQPVDGPIDKPPTVDKAPSTSPPLGLDDDEAIACGVCGKTQPLLYFPNLGWRCDDHPPAL
jgi:putative DNA primase/helicase